MDVHEPGAEMTVSRHLYTQNLEDKERYHQWIDIQHFKVLCIILEKINTIVLHWRTWQVHCVLGEKKNLINNNATAKKHNNNNNVFLCVLLF